jgi:tetratricopeptide (TPR) repeat protein
MMVRAKTVENDGRINAFRSRWWTRCALGLLVGLVVYMSGGCRAFRVDGTNKSLVTARQLSLRGADALQRSRTQDAELLFSQALALSPLDERAQWGYAMTLWERGDKQQATQHMSEALRLSGRNPEYAIQLGEMYQEIGDHAAAKKLALDVLSGNRNHARAWALLGDTHQSVGEWADSLECYHRALLIRSDYPKVQLAIAEIYRKQGKPERALATLDRMVDLHGSVRDNPEHMLFRGLVFADLNRPQEAASLLAKAAEQLPTDQLARHLEIVEVQHRMGEFVQARITLGRLAATHSQDSRVLAAKTQLDQAFAAMAQGDESRGLGSVTEPGRGVAARPVSGQPLLR